MKKFLLLLFLILAGFRVATAQDRAIQGRVTDRATGSGLPGVTVLVKGTTIGASTDSEGALICQCQLRLPPSPSASLVTPLSSGLSPMQAPLM
ncbi:carboxypeptidase-like regulatory domain-containing protein [Hymenobacter radiodurans]|uniref:carboxypeptidase-like regulatory domain-containing protein n=1 Tax=Hymenobacter radiodurans TaxID=2496028 RepID=UPI001058A1AB